MRRFTAFKDSLACRYGLREAIFLRKLYIKECPLNCNKSVHTFGCKFSLKEYA